MSKDYELDRLKSEERSAFQAKQEAYQKFQAAKRQAGVAYQVQQSAWERRMRAKDEMNHEYEAMQLARIRNNAIWEEYKRIRDSNNAKINSLKIQADSLYHNMVNAFERASDAYNYGDKAAAPGYSAEGRAFKEQLTGVNAEIRELGQEVKAARMYAQVHGSQAGSSTFNHARSVFQAAKAEHKAAEAAFKTACSERNRLKAEFNRLHVDHQRKKEAFQAALTSKRNQKEAKVRKVESALIPATGFFDGHAAKIVERKDGSGKTDVYFGGFNFEGDGLGHGHAVIESSGQVIYLRERFQDHKDYLIDDTKEKHTKI